MFYKDGNAFLTPKMVSNFPKEFCNKEANGQKVEFAYFVFILDKYKILGSCSV